MFRQLVLGLAAAAMLSAGAARAAPLRLEDHTANDAGVKIHYKAAGHGPLVVMLHGFPEYWGFWRPLMAELEGSYRVVAVDLRGYDLSDKPVGVEAYAMPKLIDDVAAVIKAEGRDRATVVGHDWGAAIAWRVAMNRPELVDKLIIMSVPHPAGFARELATDPQQQKNSQYARNFQTPGFEKNLKPEQMVRNAPATIREEYLQALKRTDMTAALNYYRANYPSKVGGDLAKQPEETYPPIKCPVLVIHGMKDQALLAAGHNGTWDHVLADTTILMIPTAGHDVQHDAEKLVDRTIHDWLNARR